MISLCRDNAVFFISCSKAVSGLCYPNMEDCVFVDGPFNATVGYISEVAVYGTMFYHIQISWEVSHDVQY